MASNEVPDSGRSDVEFRSKCFGQRQTTLFVIQTFAIWTFVGLVAALIVTKVFWHQQPLSTPSATGVVLLVFLSVLLQYFAIAAWKKVDARRVVWLSDQNCLCIYGHRIVRRFMSFGDVIPQHTLRLEDICSHKIVRGRGRFLRLQTTDGFIVLSNDLEGFQTLCDIVESRTRQSP